MRSTVLAIALAGTTAAAAGTLPRGTATVDLYGYTAASCPSDFVDIAATGTLLMPTGDAATVQATDEGAAVLALAEPFDFYGTETSSLVVSTNGYIAIAGSLDEESGTDYTNDCLLPAIPDAMEGDAGGTRAATAARLMVYHDDLDGAAGTLHAQHFAACPRAGGTGVASSCTVVQWTGYARTGSSGTIDMQAVLFHATGQLAFAYRALDASGGAGATIGIQDAEASTAVLHACESVESITAPGATCFYEPRFPPAVEPLPDELFGNGFE